ncbi:MAG: acetyl-CoA carboxylase, carboxyltransferase subunit beta [Nitrospirota bacterium]
MAWFKKPREARTEKKGKIPEGLWVKCDGCKEIVYKKEIDRNLNVCPKCNYHFRISARERLKLLVDEGSFVEYDASLASLDPLKFNDRISYRDRLRDNQEKSGLKEAAISGDALIKGFPVTIMIMDFSFMGGSMGSVVGEKVSRAAERALEKKQPFVTVSSSGGARMQEGIISLMQMAKVAASIGKLKDSGILYISILCDPTFGGVTASFASIGDIIIAEPKSLIGFAGPRVIEQTIKQPLPDDFQRADFLLEHGLVDIVVGRKNLKETLSRLFELLL